MAPRLTRLDLAELRRLLQLAESAGVAEPPSAEDIAREAALRAESDRLAALEERAARKLATLRSSLDRCSCELHSLVDRRLRRATGYDYQDAQAARRWLAGTAERLRGKLPELAKSGGEVDFETLLGIALANSFPRLFEFVGPNEPADNVIEFRRTNDDDDGSGTNE